MKRIIDLLVSFSALIATAPLIAFCSFLIWVQDRNPPLYCAERIGRDGKIFVMIKLRSMIWNAEKSQIDSTTESDDRITKVGKFIRKLKIDELPQFWNVLKGDMSLVGPRPNVQRETSLYTTVEKKMLSVRPGITDMSSIVFSDLAKILEPHSDANIAYNQLVRPWKSRLSLLCIEKSSTLLDLRLVCITLIALFNRRAALNLIGRILAKWNINERLHRVALRAEPLVAFPPPGSDTIVKSRTIS